MNFVQRIVGWGQDRKAKVKPAPSTSAALERRCHFELLESRKVLSANPVVVGITYHEGDIGQDTTPDHFEVSYVGGSATTRLTQFRINGDQDGSGTVSDGDMLFDVAAGAPGTGGFHPFLFDASASSGLTAADIKNVQVSANGLSLIVDVANFAAGDKLAFTIDVDEVEGNQLDKIASGVEFEETKFTATFEDAHYSFSPRIITASKQLENNVIQPQQSGTFYDYYDNLLAAGSQVGGATIDLRADNDDGQADRSAATIFAFNLTPKPVTLKGHVFTDPSIGCGPQGSLVGIGGVELNLERLNPLTQKYEWVAKTSTNASGAYEFGESLGLVPGTYRIVQAQPVEFLDVSAKAGTVNGAASGSVDVDSSGNKNIITGVNIPLGGIAATGYDFLEVRPIALSGRVWHDRNDNGKLDLGEEGIANVSIRVTRTGTGDSSRPDQFASQNFPIVVKTAADGTYSVEGLPPGMYEIVEISNYPPGANPLAGFIDGQDSIGMVDGQPSGISGNDQFTQIKVCAGESGAGFNFGELKPVSIGGYVGLATPEGGCLRFGQPGFQGISGVTIQLYDLAGTLVRTTQTDANGKYEFTGLKNGVYSVVEVQPTGYLDGGEMLGVVAGQSNGSKTENDRFTGITLTSGQAGVNYDFCEHLPARICGLVWHDRNDNGLVDSGEEPIGNVLIELFDKQGNRVSQTYTDVLGKYCFENLYAGEYCVKETQPAGYRDGKDSLGTIAGVSVGEAQGDTFCKVLIKGGQAGVNYNFGELKLASLSGYVLVDKDGNCLFDASKGDQPLSGVKLELLDANGEVLATTTTGEDGRYEFEDLLPGVYTVRQTQPAGYFDVGQAIGMADGQEGSGDASGKNLISGIKIGSGETLTEYNFCEDLPAQIEGRVWEDGPVFTTSDGKLPSDYRGQRDGVYQPGIDKPLPGVKMKLYFYVDPVAGELNPRPVTLKEVMPGIYPELGTNPDAAVSVLTDAQGNYSFRGLRAGSYIVVQEQPTGYTDANDVVGSTTGFSFNSIEEVALAPESVLSTFSTSQVMDSIVNIQVASAGISVRNNFTEVRAVANPTIPFLPPLPLNPLTPGGPRAELGGWYLPGLGGASGLLAFAGLDRTIVGKFAMGGIETPYTWHLSVVNAGAPRAIGESDSAQTEWLQATFIRTDDWNRFEMNEAHWSFSTTDEQALKKLKKDITFGMLDGVPLSGDFDGDGADEVAIYKDGYWLLDLNHNGAWDEKDLLARLGKEGDQPVVGDWDGDGKDDIGIYGPMWQGDPEAIVRDPGLPNPDNLAYTNPKNVPPMVAESTNGARTMQLTAFGRQRTDIVDHVFGIDEYRHVAVTGDWNGSGTRSIGTFDGGAWRLDTNGDGRFDHSDVFASYGEEGDVPVIGDFDGDGIEEIAIYRNGLWVIDTNGNRQMDEGDRRFQYGEAGDLPVVGDWDGDGRDDVGLYRRSNSAQ